MTPKLTPQGEADPNKARTIEEIDHCNPNPAAREETRKSIIGMTALAALAILGGGDLISYVRKLDARRTTDTCRALANGENLYGLEGGLKLPPVDHLTMADIQKTCADKGVPVTQDEIRRSLLASARSEVAILMNLLQEAGLLRDKDEVRFDETNPTNWRSNPDVSAQ